MDVYNASCSFLAIAIVLLSALLALDAVRYDSAEARFQSGIHAKPCRVEVVQVCVLFCETVIDIDVFSRDYFPISIKASTSLDPEKNYLLIAHPHSILPLSVFSNFATTRTGTPELFPEMTFHVCTLASNFVTAGLREILMSLGCRPVSEESIRYALSHGKGQCVVNVIGGSSEALDQDPYTYKLTLMKRTGYLRIALEEGVDLVPVFSFGESNTFEQKDNSRGTWLRKIQEALKKGIGMSPTLFWGRSIMGNEWGFLPLQRKITTVVGKPVRVKKCESKASKEDIDELRGRYVKALKELFDEHADQYAPHRKGDLKIVA